MVSKVVKKSSPLWGLVVFLSFLSLVIFLAVGFFRSLPYLDATAVSDYEVATRLLPIGHSVLGPAVSADGKAVPLTGEQIFKKTCVACHGSGVAGAPIFKNHEQWAPRIAEGLDTLVKHAIHGLGAMPPRGGNSALTDDDIRHAVIYMANNSGANFEEK